MTTLDFDKIDTQKMASVYDQWPSMARKSYEYEHELISSENINHIIFAGMGGSGAIGDIFAAILSKTNIHVTVVKGYLLPKTASTDTLVVTTSISGNTIETLTILDEAYKKKCKIIAFSSGGKMEDFCKKNNVEFRKIEKIHSPRASFTSFLYSMLKILSPIIPITKMDIEESLEKLEQLQTKINSNNLSENNSALKLALWIKKIPIIYYPHGLQAAAIRFKNSLQENAKTHAVVEDIIESCHNGIVAWEGESEFQPILLQGKNDYIKTKERWNVLKDYFQSNEIDFWETYSENGNILSKIISLIYLYDFCSIYLAIRNKIDPSPVKSIDFIKSRI